MIDTGLEGRVALVTGANSGIGAAIARALGAQRATVLLHYLEPSSALKVEEGTILHTVRAGAATESLAREVESAGGRAMILEGELSDPMLPGRLFDAGDEEGGVDILVNNAAHCESPDTTLDATAQGVDRHFVVNARAPAMLIGEFARRYRQREGRVGSIINVSTDSASAFAGQIGYGASKAALEALTRSAAIELGPFGITVNAIAPGPVQTGWMSAELVDQVVPSIPLRRVGTPEEVADAVVFLSSLQARWISGQVIQVAGGHAL